MHALITKKISTKDIVAGQASPYFYIGLVVIVMMIPVSITLWAWGKDSSVLGKNILLIRLVCVVIGDLSMRYSIFKTGKYTPIV